MKKLNKNSDLKSKDTSAPKGNGVIMYGEKIDNSTAKKMITEFKPKKNKLKFYDYIWAIFDKAKMRSLYSDPAVLEVKFFVGIFPDDSGARKKDAPVIIMQVKKDGIALTPDYEYFIGDNLCPPPNESGCGSIEQS